MHHSSVSRFLVSLHFSFVSYLEVAERQSKQFFSFSKSTVFLSIGIALRNIKRAVSRLAEFYYPKFHKTLKFFANFEALTSISRFRLLIKLEPINLQAHSKFLRAFLSFELTSDRPFDILPLFLKFPYSKTSTALKAK